jgi:hypothetical protein
VDSNVEICLRGFHPSDLLDVHFAKFDCEGCETSLLTLDRLPCPMVMEAHSWTIAKALISKFALSIRQVVSETEGVVIVSSSDGRLLQGARPLLLRPPQDRSEEGGL